MLLLKSDNFKHKSTHNKKIFNFMKWDKLAFFISFIILIISISFMFIRGFNWGIDFTGGTMIEINLKKTFNINIMRQSLIKKGFVDFQLQTIGNNNDIIIRIPNHAKINKEYIIKKMLSIINEITNQNISIKRIEFIGPNVGKELGQLGSMALLVSLICIFIYVGLRFEWRLALGTVIALIHDVIITLGTLSILYIEIDLTIIASLMSVIGYSLNDSIVVSDRIRENFRLINNIDSYDIVNISLTQILNRTIMTSCTTLMVLIVLFIFGGELLKGFSLTTFIGVFIGTISSIYVVSALALTLGMKRKHMLLPIIDKEGL